MWRGGRNAFPVGLLLAIRRYQFGPSGTPLRPRPAGEIGAEILDVHLPPRAVHRSLVEWEATLLDHQAGHVTVGDELDLDLGLLLLAR